MRRGIVVGLIVVSFVALCLFAGLHDQKEDEGPVVVERIREKLRNQGSPLDERELLERLLEAVTEELGPEHPSTFEVMTELAVQRNRQGDYTGARDLLEKVIEIQLNVLGEEHPDTATAMENLGEILREQRDYLSAHYLFEEALEIRRDRLGSEHPATLAVMSNLALTLAALGDSLTAQVLGEDALETGRRVLGSEHPVTLEAMANLAGILSAQGHLAEARELLHEALATRRRLFGSEDPETLKVMQGLAMAFLPDGHFSAARELLQEVLETRRRVLGSEHPDTLRAMANMAIPLMAEGNHPAAREELNRALGTQRRVLGWEHPDTLETIKTLGIAHVLQGDMAAALKFFDEVLMELNSEKAGSFFYELAATREMAGILRDTSLQSSQHLDSQDLPFLDNLQSQLNDISDDDELLRLTFEGQSVLINASLEYLEDASCETIVPFSEELCEATEGDSRNRFNISNRAKTLEALTEMHRSREKYAKAMEHYHATEQELTKYLERYTDPAPIIAEQTKWHKLQLDNPRAALQALEQYRAVRFLELLSERASTHPRTDNEINKILRENPSLYNARENSRRYDAIIREIDKADSRKSEAEIADLRRKQDQLRTVRALWDNLMSEDPTADGAQTEEYQPFNLHQIRRVLDHGTVMLSYGVSEAGIDVYSLTREKRLRVYRVPVDERSLWRHVFKYYTQLENKSIDRAASRRENSKWFFEKLITPVIEEVGKAERLLIIPDGPLHYVPFGAMIHTREEDAETRPDWQYLIEWKPVHTVLSATVYAHLRALRPKVRAESGERRLLGLAAFGDPIYPGMDPETSRDGTDKSVLPVAVDRGHFDGLTALPHSRREVTEIGRLFSREPVGIYLGLDATEEQAKSLGKDVNIVHFAVHGVLDDLSPLDSFLAFTIPDETADRDNGLLQAWEIFERVRLDADLVVLSGCKTAIGPQRGGDGLISLSRAFQYAGARSVLASLWTVSDQSTAELMIRFYRHLRDGKPKDEALQAAQIELIRGGPIEVVDENGNAVKKDYSAPYHWAAFQLIGDWQ